jgi:hypothetical protein
VPVTNKEREARAGKAEGQPARTREVRLGCVFTQTATDKDGRPIRDPDSTTYVAAIETAEEFGLRLYTDAWRRGWSEARQEGRARRRRDLDLEPQRSALSRRDPDCGSLFITPASTSGNWPPSSSPTTSGLANAGRPCASINSIEARSKLVKILRGCAQTKRNSPRASATTPTTSSATLSGCAIRSSAPRVCWSVCRFVSSGVVEAGCRTVVGKRLKYSGMFWSVGANAILALRCCRLSGRFDHYRESRSRAA